MSASLDLFAVYAIAADLQLFLVANGLVYRVTATEADKGIPLGLKNGLLMVPLGGTDVDPSDHSEYTKHYLESVFQIFTLQRNVTHKDLETVGSELLPRVRVDLPNLMEVSPELEPFL